MKKLFIIAGMLMLSGLAQAREFSRGDIVYDNILRRAMYISDIRGGDLYVRNFRGDEMEYPRYNADLVPRVHAIGKLKEKMEISLYNQNDRKWYYDEIKLLFANHVAYFAGIWGIYVVGEQYLGVPVDSVPGSKLRVGSRVCTIKKSTHYRKAGDNGKILKLFSNGSAKVSFVEFIIKDYEVVPLDNLRPCSK